MSYMLLDLLGVNKETRKKVKLKNMEADCCHSFLGSYCDCIVSDDEGLRQKSKTLYKLFNFGTKVYSIDNTVIEIKRSTNENLIHGYRTQLPAYMKAERAKTGIFMIIMEKDNIEEIKQKFTEVQKDMLDNDEYIPEIIYINGMKQYSASNRNYKFSEFT